MPGVQLEEDVRDECAEYGTVEGVCIPCPPKTMPPDEPGRAYIMFSSHEEASKAKPVFDGRLFDNMKVTAKLVPDEDFARAAAGEWIHIPMPGGLPAHPGYHHCLLLSSPLASLLTTVCGFTLSRFGQKHASSHVGEHQTVCVKEDIVVSGLAAACAASCFLVDCLSSS